MLECVLKIFLAFSFFIVCCMSSHIEQLDYNTVCSLSHHAKTCFGDMNELIQLIRC